MPDIDDFDITNSIQTIERLKHALLSSVSDLHGNLLKTDSNIMERGKILADIVITAYILSGRLGISYASVNEHVLNQLKLLILDEKNPLQADAANMLKHMGGLLHG